jgi:hypothetical protein
MATNLSLPPINILASAAADLVIAAADAGNTPRVNALNKASLYLHEGVQITLTCGGALIPSGTRGGTVHRVTTVYGCSCESARAGRICWHAALIEIIEAAQVHAIPMADRIAAARRVAREKAEREMAELFG